ncbi:MAG: hypothetical protein IT310_07930 [Anaerolineales bacterium]|nr:hypothetical protein [Anaerolineales bacterium]
MNKIILLDIDGVLVRQGGYRAALNCTLKYFLGPNFQVDERLIVALEERGVSSEWDMTPLIIAAYWNLSLLKRPKQNLPGNFSAAVQRLQELQPSSPLELSIPPFELRPNCYPAEAAFLAGCFSAVPIKLRQKLLTHTRDIQSSETFRVFQNFTLGSQSFAETYGQPALFQTDSLLLKYDAPNLSAEIRNSLLQHPLVGFTARPSAVPREVEGSIHGYAPEAEYGLTLCGLSDIPLMAFGKLQYLAAQHQLDPATLMKPAPFQALAGVLAAWAKDEWLALQAANHWRVSGKLSPEFQRLPKQFELIVVEDTLGGIRSAQGARAVLQQAGFEVNFKPIGITSGSVEKASAFANAGIFHAEGWQNAIAEILS